ncbi:MAG TPA: peptide ABC transporter substrate-binding protein [Opitutus sp.]|nr:peptide ABC transporter substrate-binding protein [Opitutus sp.]
MLRAFFRGLPLLAATIALGLLVACARREGASASSTEAAQVLHMSVGPDPNDLDPQRVSTNQAAAIAMALGEGLTNYDPADLHPVPGVAASWEISPDGLVYTFHLRPDARWSDGTPVTADDFVFSARRILSPAFAGEFAYMFFVVKGAEDITAGRSTDFSRVGVRALDAHTLRYELRQPAPYFLTLVAHWSWYPVQPATILKFGRIDEPSTAWTRPGNFVGNGPFALAEWRPGDAVVARKNPHYWDVARVRLQEIDFRLIDNSDAEERAFRSGQLHVTESVPHGKLATYQAAPGGPLRIVPIFATDMVSLNLHRVPLDQPLVRQALALAIDRAAISAQIMRDGSQPAASLVPAIPHGYEYRGEEHLRFDPAEARHRLAAAGFPGGRGFPRFELSFPTGRHWGPVAEALQQMWRENLGIEVALAGAESRVFADNLHGHRFDVALTGWIGDYLDPMSYLDVYLGASGHNDPDYHDAGYDRFMAAAATAADPIRRNAFYSQAEAQLLHDLPIIPLYHRPNLHLVSPRLHGYEANLMDMHPFQQMWLGPP